MLGPAVTPRWESDFSAVGTLLLYKLEPLLLRLSLQFLLICLAAFEDQFCGHKQPGTSMVCSNLETSLLMKENPPDISPTPKIFLLGSLGATPS